MVRRADHLRFSSGAPVPGTLPRPHGPPRAEPRPRDVSEPHPRDVSTSPGAATVDSIETYAYDDLQRLTGTTRSWAGLTRAPEGESYGYDDLGNILWKGDYGSGYGYGTPARATGNAGPHAVASVAKLDGTTATFAYDANGNMTSGDGRTVDFDLMDRPVRVSMAGATTDFSYAPDGARYRQKAWLSPDTRFGPKTTYQVDKDYELVVWDSLQVEERAYVSPAVVTYRSGTTTPAAVREVRYLHLDRLGSLDAVTRDDLAASSQSVDWHGYDPFGKPRAPDETPSGERLHPSGDAASQAVTTDRGFTGHEHLDSSYLIHMNGRVYDYRLGRFLSVDPFISNPLSSQSINPYSYIGNNPLSGTDPTGFMSVGTGCGSYSACDVIMVNPPASAINVYMPSIYSCGSVGQTAQVAKTAPQEVQNPAQVADQDPKTYDDGVLLAQNVPRPVRGGGARAEPPERLAEVPEEDFAARSRLAQEDNINRELDKLEPGTVHGARIGPPGQTLTQERLDALWRRIQEMKEQGVPNPYGSRGSPEHQQVIHERIEQLRTSGHEHVGGGGLPEEVVPTPGGTKSSRRPDITTRAPDGTVQRENVGRSTQTGQPVARERRALDDIEKATGQRPAFTPYDKR